MEKSIFDPVHDDIKRHAASGFFFSAVSQGMRILTQFASVVLLARLLTPEDFGVVAKVMPVYVFAYMFHDMGLSQSTIQKPDLKADEVNAFFWVNVAVGLFITVVLIALSPLVGLFYGDGRTVSLTIALAILVGLSGLGNQQGALLYRRMAFRQQAFLSAAGAVAALLASVSWAYFFHSYWALYAGMAAGTIIPTMGAWLSTPWLPSRPRLVANTGKMLTYGFHITAGNFIGFVVNNLNNVVIGRFLGDDQLGFYDRASRLWFIPLQQIISPIGDVIMPILYRLHDDEEKYRNTFLRAVGTLSLCLVPAVLWLVVAADSVIAVALGQKWHQTVPVFAALSFAVLPVMINSTAGWLIMTQGRSKDFAHWSFVNGAFTIAALLAGLPYGIIGVAIAMAVVHSIRTPFYWRYACRKGPVRVKHVFLTLAPQLAGAVVTAPSLYIFKKYCNHSEQLSLLVLGACLSYALVLSVMSIFPSGRASIRRDLEFAKFMLSRAA